MKAVVISRSGGPEVLEVRGVPDPVPGAHEVLVKVMATALNRADLLQREGKYPAPPGVPSDIPGMEFAGAVAALGSGASRWTIGQRVFGIVGGGAQAQFLVTHEDTLAEVPANLDWAHAAAVPEVFITAHDAMWTQAGLQPNENVLIHSVGSGVGLAAVQLARAKGAVPFGTSRTPEKLQQARGFGLEAGIAIENDLAPLKTFAAEHTGNRGFDVALDLVGGKYVGGTIPAMALKGRIMLIGTVAGAVAEMNLGLVLGKRLRLMGTTLRARPLEEKIAVNRAFEAEVLPLLAAGSLKPVIDQTFDLEEVRAAHQRLESNASFGKVVLFVPH
ncbi:MAG TPA: NAD(P)H-quinone oxidoreductase [Terriglobales bacterium]|nr:NAD(P)H-quinone oxidoreductase [Terriglobales bacterium]